MLDLLIKNTTIVDGTGNPKFKGSVGVKDGKLKLLPENAADEAKKVIDGSKYHTAPGFIDPHSHGDVPLGEQWASLSKISQGITTHVAGQCGFSMFPVNPDRLELMKEGMAIFTNTFPKEMATFTTFENYLKYARTLKLPENVKFQVGHVSLRIAAMGFDNREPTEKELEHMKSMLREAMENGAGGYCTGFIYIPNVYAKKEEIIELCKVVAEYDGIYTTHMRNESDDILGAVKESIDVARASGCRLQISHLKVSGKQNWRKYTKDVLKLIEDANREGVRVTCDQYPYNASMTHLNICVPAKYFTKGISHMVEYLKDPVTREEIRQYMTQENSKVGECGGWGGIFIASARETLEYEGKTIAELAEERGMDGFDVFCDILIRNNGVASAIYFAMNEEDVFDIIKDDHVMVGTDGIVRSETERAHPRAYGSFTRAINYFVKENQVMSLEKMIRKMTGFTAEATMLSGKGYIKDGYDADLTIFDLDAVKDKADFVHSSELSDGIEYVIVGGEIVYHDKQLTGATPGKIILHKR